MYTLEEKKEKRRQEYLRNREKELAAHVIWRKTHKERVAFHQKAKNANDRYTDIKLTTKDIDEIVAKSGRICYWCGKSNLEGRDITLEHLKPTNDKRFIVIACYTCNSKRFDIFGIRTEEEKKAQRNAKRHEWYDENGEEYLARTLLHRREYIRQYWIKKGLEEIRKLTPEQNKRRNERRRENYAKSKRGLKEKVNTKKQVFKKEVLSKQALNKQTHELGEEDNGVQTSSIQRKRFYIRVRKQIFKRDDYTCQICNKKGGILHVDHIKSWIEYPELRFEMNNCRTLCRACHYFVTYGKEMPKDSRWGLPGKKGGRIYVKRK